MPTAICADGLRARSDGGGHDNRRARTLVSRETTIHSPWSSATMLDTVDRARPVWRAICARLAVPSALSASITRPVFDSRSAPSEPVLSPSIPRAILFAGRKFCQAPIKRLGLELVFVRLTN